MKIFLKSDASHLAKTVLDEKLCELGVKFSVTNLNEIHFLETISDEKFKQISSVFSHYGFQILENQKNILVEKIKETLIEIVFREEAPVVKYSVFLAEKLNHNYTYLSGIFSEVTYTSIENFTILQKIERVKYLITDHSLNLTEIAYKLNYSSVAHLSTQFKNATGLTPTAFSRIIERRRELANKTLNHE